MFNDIFAFFYVFSFQLILEAGIGKAQLTPGNISDQNH